MAACSIEKLIRTGLGSDDLLGNELKQGRYQVAHESIQRVARARRWIATMDRLRRHIALRKREKAKCRAEATVKVSSPKLHFHPMHAKVQMLTLAALAELPDAWLDIAGRPFLPKLTNYEKLFHVIEDEINHRGQVHWLRKRLPGHTDRDNEP